MELESQVLQALKGRHNYAFLNNFRKKILTASKHIMPTFFLIGERKCGTSSLYRYLIHHPNILPCALKEPNFFGKGAAYVASHLASYWSLFPLENSIEDRTFDWPELDEKGILYEEKVVIPRLADQGYITGEASANTFFEVAPSLVKKYLPNIKLILLFRNPIDRTFSHHRMYQRFQLEGRILKKKVHTFEEDIRQEMALLQAGGQGGFLTPSIYLPQLKNWVDTFGTSSIRLYYTEDLKIPEKAAVILADLQAYLELPLHNYGDILTKRFNQAPPAVFSTKLRKELEDFFQPYNQDLFTYIRETALVGKYLTNTGRWTTTKN